MNRFSGCVRFTSSSRLAHTTMRALPAAGLVTSSTATAVSAVQRRYQFYTDPAKRDHEAFLATYDPLQVLGLPEDATAREVHEAAERKKAQYGAGSKDFSKHKLETVERAYDLLRDVSSPYYTKAGASDKFRHRLQVDMLPPNNRRTVQFQLVLMACLVGVGILMLLKQVLLPMQKSLRAATR